MVLYTTLGQNDECNRHQHLRHLQTLKTKEKETHRREIFSIGCGHFTHDLLSSRCGIFSLLFKKKIYIIS